MLLRKQELFTLVGVIFKMGIMIDHFFYHEGRKNSYEEF